jgi:hypothetical protein
MQIDFFGGIRPVDGDDIRLFAEDPSEGKHLLRVVGNDWNRIAGLERLIFVPKANKRLVQAQEAVFGSC